MCACVCAPIVDLFVHASQQIVDFFLHASQAASALLREAASEAAKAASALFRDGVVCGGRVWKTMMQEPKLSVLNE